MITASSLFTRRVARYSRPKMHRLLALVIAITASGCSWFRSAPPKPTIIKMPRTQVVEQVPKLVGTVTIVNTDDRFVIVEGNQRAPLNPGTALKCIRDGIETGIIAIGKERRGPNVTADIVKGDPQKGDQVFE